MKRKTTPVLQATVHYQACPVEHVDKRLRELVIEWDGYQSSAEYHKPLDLRSISYIFPTAMKRYRFIQRARKYFREIEQGLCGFVEFK
ncbi:hypothetical protein LCGC14_0817210 [marine sediment metagenome]|uniref:Uncharacterized protein n=1 Tax=marine sediment metagenome TaxID=412755 RepID=A0A0F9PJU3_9ZZZZ